MRNWNRYIIFWVKGYKPVFTVPMRNWNLPNFIFFFFLRFVFTVPMRNWNSIVGLGIKLQPKGFYSTYEELKLNINIHYSDFFARFLQYLWGIETFFYSYSAIPYLQVFTVPMRNWNYIMYLACFYWYYVFTVPMRNWNRGHRGSISQRGRFLQYLWGIETFLPKQ